MRNDVVYKVFRLKSEAIELHAFLTFKTSGPKKMVFDDVINFGLDFLQENMDIPRMRDNSLPREGKCFTVRKETLHRLNLFYNLHKKSFRYKAELVEYLFYIYATQNLSRRDLKQLSFNLSHWLD